MSFFVKKPDLPAPDQALPGRTAPLDLDPEHFVVHRSMLERPEGSSEVLFGMGCFWGAEKKFWSLRGVHTTAVGYAGGVTPNPNYEEVCSGFTGHTEVVRVVYFEDQVSLDELLMSFWENHDPTQGMRQGNDTGTQYRSAIYVENEEALEVARRSLAHYQAALTRSGFGTITTELRTKQPFFFAETYHQQYLAKNPNGYCGIGGTGVRCTSPL